ncbi:MAG: hypothetical protein K5634_07700 [Sphaerochaetaceae bacterium]|nr:hypothetical protein [Sphaerochaetaceae bacterium]
MQLLEGTLMIAFLEYGQGDRFQSIARSGGAGGATAVPAIGTASSRILRMLGLGDKRRDTVLVLFDRTETALSVIDAAEADGRLDGVCALITSNKENNMKADWKMITIIVNSGYADDIMHVARKAGAEGGTIIHARGTAPVDGEKFLGVSIVPDKEMVVILCEEGREKEIASAIENMDCLQEKGVGIMYIQDVCKFVRLGEKN